jgi:hypothetical protein
MTKNGNLVTTIEIKDKQGRVIATEDVVTYAGLLSLAHDQGLHRIETAVVQLPDQTNGQTAVCSAVVETEKGLFKGHGDASPENVGSRIIPHIIRMAETRAKARALRDAVNIGIVAVEELAFETNSRNGGNGDEVRANGNHGAGSPGRSQKRQRIPADSQQGPGESEPMSEAQRRYIFRLLAERDVVGDSAQEFILSTLRVKSMANVSKAQASALIEELLKPVKQAEEVPF